MSLSPGMGSIYQLQEQLNLQSATIASLRQQLEELKVNHKAELVMRDQNSQMYLDNTRQQLAEVNTLFAGAVEQLAEASRKRKESQAREKVLRDTMKLANIQYMGCGGNLLPGEIVDAMTRILNNALSMPSDSTALEQVKLAAKREALLEAATEFEELNPTAEIARCAVGDVLRRMADNINKGD